MYPESGQSTDTTQNGLGSQALFDQFAKRFDRSLRATFSLPSASPVDEADPSINAKEQFSER